MKTRDHHHCECKHDRIKFCAKCKVPHCLDCGLEWVTKPATWYYNLPYTNTVGVYGTGTASGTVFAGNNGLTGDSATLTACQHTS